MTWFKVDDGLAFHPKAIAAGNAALGLWVRAGSWCGSNLTGGALPRHMIGTLGAQARDARRLVAAGLWCETEDGYQFKDWHEYQPTKEQVTAEREATRKRAKRWREQHRNGVTNGVANGVSNAVSTPAPTRPDPTIDSATGSQSSNGRNARGNSDRLDLQRLATILHSDEPWAQRVATQVLDRAPANVKNPTAYIERAIREHIDDYRPTPTPPSIKDLCWHGRVEAVCPDCRASSQEWA